MMGFLTSPGKWLDFVGIVAIVAGLNIIPTRTKPGTAITGTSIASIGSRKIFGEAKFPFGIKLPSVVGGYPPSTLRPRMIRNVGAFVGRGIPVVGWVILATDVSEISYRTVVKYNAIARGNDKLWQ
ncbi:hypothetical protein GCM10022405_22560 [Gibbsiella dentisursi]|uniref:Phage membrane protein n=1 Tax=Gibbsiella dentisursi TaxID=796890 RepID=A0ABP7LDF7_9GAMM|nr:hypothetical protein [Gibbsiella quercinecans]